MESREGSVGVLVDPDARLDVVGTLRPGGELEDPSAVAHGVVAHRGEETVEDVGAHDGFAGDEPEIDDDTFVLKGWCCGNDNLPHH